MFNTKLLYLRLIATAAISCAVPTLHSQTLIWDANATTAGQRVGKSQPRDQFVDDSDQFGDDSDKFVEKRLPAAASALLGIG